MSERGFRPDRSQAAAFGPLDERELASVLESDPESQESWYARMLDCYHEMYAQERQLIAKSRGLGHDEETKSINDGRDQLHKQLERLGRQLGKSKDVVQADVIGREGNLGEYDLPEFGLLTFDQLAEDRDGFAGNTFQDMRRGKFVHANSSVSVLEQRRQMEAQRKEWGVAERDADAVRTFRMPVVGMPDEQEFATGLMPGEAAVIFGNMFTVDVHQDSVEIIPPGYPERVRRSLRAAEALRERGVNARALMHTVGGYHDTVTVVWVAVPTEKIDPETVGLLRGNRKTYGVRTGDMDAEAMEAEYRAGLVETPDNDPIRPQELLRALSDGRLPEVETPGIFALLEADDARAWSADEYAAAIRERIPNVDSSVIGQALDDAKKERVRSTADYRQAFLEVHEEFFGKR